MRRRCSKVKKEKTRRIPKDIPEQENQVKSPTRPAGSTQSLRRQYPEDVRPPLTPQNCFLLQALTSDLHYVDFFLTPDLQGEWFSCESSPGVRSCCRSTESRTALFQLLKYDGRPDLTASKETEYEKQQKASQEAIKFSTPYSHHP